jgi:sulfur carrier protein ThiS
MEIEVQLYSILREKLPPEAKGKAVFQLNEEATLSDLLRELDITQRVVISINGFHSQDKSQQLVNGDQIKIFSSISGG